ncbi:PRA1 family protein F2-like [Momordica charantia]|uniref:PRA1 family protein n=1 Tax=Momordica charantia TaxID=3673 RepID=A0A6J1D4U6_MOMCH|nr:PRA1 family protein F2-like [Momordica charantia]
MTNYGTIPTSSSSSSPGVAANLEYISRAKQRFKDGLGHRRPWRLMADYRSFTLPSNLHDTLARIRTNLSYFRMNYAIVFLVILFFSLLWHPISLIVLAIMMALWLFLYFLRDEPLILVGRVIEDWIVLLILSLLTIGFLFLTNATLNIVIALLIGAVLVVAHAAVRKTENLYLDEEAAGLIVPGS